jgi:PAS domain S-box-containing protein
LATFQPDQTTHSGGSKALIPKDPKKLALLRETPIRILLLEDNPADASLALQILKAAGIQVTSDVVRTSPAFMDAMRNKPYQVILCDYSLPGWNGLDALRWLRSSGFKMPFIYVSGTLGEEVAVECIKEGATDYVIKANLERLPRAVRRALQEEQLRLETERVQDEMHKSEERYRLLFESNPQPMWVFHLATLRFLAVNEAAIDYYAYSRSEFLSMTLRDICPPEEIPALEDSIWKNPGYPEKPRIWRHRTKFGRIVYVETTSRNIEFEGLAASLVVCKDVSALRRSEENLRLLFEQTPDGIFVADAEGRFLGVNPAGVQLMGYSPDELRQRNLTDVVGSGEVERVPLESARLESGDVVTLEWRFKRKDGSIFDGSLVARQLSDGRLLGIVRDITETKRANQRLRESEENYRTLFESMDEGFCTIEVLFNENNECVDYRFLEVNPVFEKLTGIPNARGKRMREIAPEHEEYWFSTYGKVALTGEPVRLENLASQLHRWFEVHAFRVGEPQERKLAVFFDDITDRKRVEAELRKSEERFSKAFRNSPLAITISADADGRYLDVNDAFLNLLGYKREDVIGRTATELRFWSDPSDREEMVQQLKEDETVAKRNTRYQTTKGEIREAEVWAQSIELDGQRCVLAITRDVTEIRQLEAQFRQAQKMEAVGQLAGGVAHDFNNLLMIIASYARLIPLHRDEPEKIERHAMQIEEAVSRAASVTQQLLAFSRKQVLLPTVLDLNTLVLGLGKMLPRLLGADVAMSIATRSWGKVKADATQLEQVILNLAVNARDAMPSGGKLVIETSDVYLDGAYPGHQGTAIPAGDYVMLAVSDTGIGMNQETQSHIFEPFFTTKGRAGTGLGLATVYGIVKQSGGFIWVYSELGKGTTFKVYLTRIEGEEERSERGIASVPDPRGTETILLAEDEVALRTVMDIYLESLGYTVLTAGNGEEALEILQGKGQSIDVLITDIIMPGIGGPQLAKRTQEIRPGVAVIYISGYTDRALDRSTIGEGATFLQKPFSLGSLAVNIREILGDQS